MGKREGGRQSPQAWREFRIGGDGVSRPVCNEWIDAREDYGEERTILLGMSDGSILVVVYSEREERVRLISARRATKNEQDIYYRENGS